MQLEKYIVTGSKICYYTKWLLVAGSTLTFWIPWQTPFASTRLYSSVDQTTRDARLLV